MDERDQARPSTPPEASGILDSREIFWRNLQPWLQQSGYTLRPRFRRGWIPSWKIPGSDAHLLVAEDSWGLLRGQIMDAVRDADGLQVALKRVSKSKHPFEEGIHRFLSAPGSEISQDPTNHCVPLLDVLQPPNDADLQILVMELLRKCDSPPFDTVGEVVDFFNQIFEGLQFMHKHLVAHRDCSSNNIMMTSRGMYPDGFHPQYQTSSLDMKKSVTHSMTRTQRPPKYYFIDFGISVRLNAEERRSALPIVGADQTVPEYQNDGHVDPQDPFATDIYFLGNLIREEFLDGQSDPRYQISPGRVGFEFMRSLVTDMVNVDPTKRPTIDEVVLRFDKIKSGLGSWKLRSRVRSKDEIRIFNIPRILNHWKRKIRYIVDGTPPIPVYG
ncbi:kinase-like domain-containing protein [Mycena alexandri]|uniref:Kinase-like domain-containing protein n=1 Tax=Mycena alexandri TaxID=1745969 RepID=A0AAD6SKG2_9AGAR|nr:kinase-like domain-containing protein [Mycena alexandri]KAJ7028526.1 kinase-like domain-containing protein [Mycena alexandri]